MGRRGRKPYPIFEQVEILDLTIDGKAVAKVKTGEDDRLLTVFVKKVLPGDVVDLKVVKRRKNFIEAVPVKFHKYSEKRTEAFCEHFGICGGCTRQFLDYKDQLFYKHKAVADVLQRIGQIELPEIMPIFPSEDTKFYRNKLEYTFSNKRWLTDADMENRDNINDHDALGFHVPGRFDKVLDINNCYLQAEPSNSIRLAVKQFALENKLSFFDLREQTGLLRNLIIRTAVTGDIMVIISFAREDKEKREALLNYLADKFPEITSLQYVINNKRNDTIHDLDVHTFKGKSYILESMEELKFKVGAKSFYQTNSKQAYELYKIARNFADLKGGELLYDLYTGTGTIAQFMAKKARKVIGIEYVEASIEDAKENAKLNNLDNTAFFAGDMKDILTEDFIHTHGKPDIIITDPPRAGMHKKVINAILKTDSPKIVYISCNPATQARDLQLLDEKYKVVKVQAVDMFPHTHHVENVVLLEKK